MRPPGWRRAENAASLYVLALPMCTLYVGGLPPQADTDFVRSLFAGFGDLLAVRLVRRAPEGPHRGFGYVTFDDPQTAVEAQLSLDGTAVETNTLRVAPAT